MTDSKIVFTTKDYIGQVLGIASGVFFTVYMLWGAWELDQRFEGSIMFPLVIALMIIVAGIVAWELKPLWRKNENV